MPTMVGNYPGRGTNAFMSDTQLDDGLDPYQMMGITTVAASGTNILWTSPGANETLQQFVSEHGRANNVRQ